MKGTKKIKGILRDHYTLKIILIVVLFVLFFGGAAMFSVYQTATQKIKNLSSTISENNLLDLKNIVESYLQYCEDISINLCLDEDAVALADTSHCTPIQTYRMTSSLTRQLTNIKNGSLMIESIYLYYPSENKVIYNAQYRAEDVVDLTTFSCGAVPSHDVAYFLTEDYFFSRFAAEQPKDVIKIVRHFPQSSVDAYVVLNISVEFLRNTLERYSVREQDYFILDRDNRILLSSNADAAFLAALPQYLDNGEAVPGYTLVGPLPSSETSWNFISTVPTSIIVRENRTILLSSLAFLLMMILAGFAVSILLTIQASKPLTSLFFKLNGSDGLNFTVEEKAKSLGNLYQSLNASNTSLTEFISANIPALQERFFMCLLFGRFPSRDHLLTAMKNAQISFPHPKFAVCLFSLEFPEKTVRTGEYLSSLMSQILITDSLNQICPFFIVQMELTRFAILLNCKESAKLSAFETIFAKIIEEQKKTLNIGIHAGISDFADSLFAVPHAYSQACDCLDYHAIVSPGSVISYSEINILPANGPIYPFHLEQDLIAAIKTKSASEISGILQKLEGHFQQNPEFSFAAMRYIYLSLMSNVKKVLYEVSNDSNEWKKLEEIRLSPITGDETVAACVSNLRQVALFIHEFIQNKLANKKSSTIRRILEYIQNHYEEPTLSSDDIAAGLYISIPHLYALLKEAGLTPIGYLNEIRCKKAIELLLHTSKTVKEIAACCGFENVQIFYRQFKKYTGLSPSQYRQIHSA